MKQITSPALALVLLLAACGRTIPTSEEVAASPDEPAVQLEDIVRDESGHSEETERILRDWPL